MQGEDTIVIGYGGKKSNVCTKWACPVPDLEAGINCVRTFDTCLRNLFLFVFIYASKHGINATMTLGP
jgi:hypothetical protein